MKTLISIAILNTSEMDLLFNLIDDFIVFVALVNNKVVGGLTSYLMKQYYSKSPLVYIFDLAVKTEFQRQGIGKMLIKGNNNYCTTIGAEEVMVQADEEVGYAIDFYKSTGAIGQKVIHFGYLLDNIKKNSDKR